MSKFKQPEVGDVVQVQAGWAKGQRGTVLDVGESVTVQLFGDFPAKGCFPPSDLFVLPEEAPGLRQEVE